MKEVRGFKWWRLCNNSRRPNGTFEIEIPASDVTNLIIDGKNYDVVATTQDKAGNRNVEGYLKMYKS